MQSYCNFHGQQPVTSAASVKNLTGPSPSHIELVSDLIFTIKEKVKRAVDERSDPPQQGDSCERPTLVCPALANVFWNDFLSTSRTSFNQPIVNFWLQIKLKNLF